MDYIQAKHALDEICQRGGSGDERGVKKILDEHPSLINEDLDSNGSSVLILSAAYNQIENIKLLLSYDKININKQNNDGWTALHCASYNGYKGILELLLSHIHINMNLRNNKGKLASDICCHGYDANKSNKPIILELFKNHSLPASSSSSPLKTATSTHYNEGNLPADAINRQLPTNIKESKIEDEVKECELLSNIDGKERFQLEIQSLEVKIREIINSNIKEMERKFQEKDSNMKLMVKNLIENTVEQMLNKREKDEKEIGRKLQVKEKECVALRNQIVKMEVKFEAWMEQMEISQKELERRLDEKERVLQDSTGRGVTSLPLPPNKQTHVFLTHTWRADEKGRNNHDRVGRVNEALRKRGLVTWFDSERLEDKIHETISKALYSTCCVLIFVTREYEKKVNSANDSDYCFYEFNVAATDPELANMRIPIVMDESMLNPIAWDKGLLKAGLGGKVFIDLSNDDKDVFEERCNEVFVRVVKLLDI